MRKKIKHPTLFDQPGYDYFDDIQNVCRACGLGALKLKDNEGCNLRAVAFPKELGRCQSCCREDVLVLDTSFYGFPRFPKNFVLNQFINLFLHNGKSKP